MTLGGFLGNLLVGPLSSILGRRHNLAISCALNIFCVGLMYTTNFGALYFSRIFVGISIGLMGALAQIYVVEILPAHLRGTMIAWYNWWIALAGIIGSVVTNATAYLPSRAAYYIPLGICFIIPGLLLPTLFFLPESPRYLITRGKHEQAERALRSLRGASVTEEVLQRELRDMRAAAMVEEELKKSASLVDLFRGTNLVILQQHG